MVSTFSITLNRHALLLRSIAALFYHAQSPLRTSGAGLRATARRALHAPQSSSTTSGIWDRTLIGASRYHQLRRRLDTRCVFALTRDGGAGRDRTDDLKLAKLPLSQLSYGPILLRSNAATHRRCWLTGSRLTRLGACLNCLTQSRSMHAKSMVGLGRLELPTSRLSSARSNQLSYRP